MQYIGWIYKWTNKTNGKVYIGQTMNKKGYKERWLQHLSNARTFKYKSYFYNALRKYGEENFTKEILYELKNTSKVKLKSQLDRLEIELIEKYDSINPLKGYNSTKGGEFNVWNSLNEDDERYVEIIERLRDRKSRAEESYDALRKEVVLVDKDDNLIKKFKSITEASNYLNIHLVTASEMCKCGSNRGTCFVPFSGKTKDGNKLRHVEDWLDGLTESEIRRRYSNFPMEDIEFEECNIEEFTIETHINGDIINNSFPFPSKNIEWFYQEGYKKLTKKQIGFIRGEVSVSNSNRKRLIRTIQKRLGLTNN